MSRNPLPTDRLSTTDKTGKRVYLYPAVIKTGFQKYRKLVQWILIFILLILPWTKINGIQTLLFDIPKRRFSIFGLTFWAHDGPMLFFVAALFLISFAMITSIFGRIWCGWACPETVLVEAMYRQIERFVEGDHVQRKKRDEGKLNFDKIFRRSLKWFLYLIVTIIITNSILAYFVGANTMIEMVTHSPFLHKTEFGFFLFLTALFLFAFGWFREQFCIIMCPYGRFQTTMVDKNTLQITYDVERGEPRGLKSKKDSSSETSQGDCIDCYKCVNVCPTGIDIRRGLQMECIGCAACIDACDEVMEKLKKPKGLIRYTNESHSKINLLRPRVLIYLSIFFVLLSGFGFVLSKRVPIDIVVLRSKEIPYQIIGDEISNHFELSVSNHLFEDVTLNIKSKNDQIKIIYPQIQSIEQGKTKRVSFFLKGPKAYSHQNVPIEIESVTPSQKIILTEKEAPFLGP